MADKYAELAEMLKPYIYRMIREVVGDQHGTSGYGESGSAFGVLLYDTSAGKVSVYAGDSDGLDAALAGAAAGDIIILPPGTISGDHSLVANVKVVGFSRYATILSGEITGASGASLERLTILRTVATVGDEACVHAPASGTVYIDDCHIEINQSSSGNCYGLYAAAGGKIEAWNSYIEADGGGSNAWATYREAGDIIVHGGQCLSSNVTGPCNE